MVTDEEKKRQKSSFFLPKSSQSPIPSTEDASKAQTNNKATHQSSLPLNKSKTELNNPVIPESLASLPTADLSPVQCVSVTADILKKVVSNKMNSNKDKTGRKVPLQLEAVIEYFIELCPQSSGYSGTKRAPVESQKFHIWRSMFPINCSSFTIPYQSKYTMTDPDPDYALIENTTLYFLHWPLINNIEIPSQPPCPYCKIGYLKTLQ